MKYFLGFSLQKDICKQLRNLTKEISQTFDEQGIPVRWTDPKDYNISLHNYYKLSFIQKFVLEKKLTKMSTSTFTISLHRLKLGETKRMRGLIYFSIDKGGEHLRHLKSELGKNLRIKETPIFVPNIVIGRVSKDLTKQEYSNILKDFESLQENVNGVQFQVSTLGLIELR
ncbi:TPA: hypothetical protein DEP90_02995 [Patescibacteria group bacterium]|nr:hypothetical protein [Patescibacteria group bacterium]